MDHLVVTLAVIAYVWWVYETWPQITPVTEALQTADQDVCLPSLCIYLPSKTTQLLSTRPKHNHCKSEFTLTVYIVILTVIPIKLHWPRWHREMWMHRWTMAPLAVWQMLFICQPVTSLMSSSSPSKQESMSGERWPRSPTCLPLSVWRGPLNGRLPIFLHRGRSKQ